MRERLALRSRMATTGWPILSIAGIGKAKAQRQSALNADPRSPSHSAGRVLEERPARA
jgi:hypothetical protein